MSKVKGLVLVNAVSAKAGGGLNDLIHTLPLLEYTIRRAGYTLVVYVVEQAKLALEKACVETECIEVLPINSPAARLYWEIFGLPTKVRKLNPVAVFQFSNFVLRKFKVPQLVVFRSVSYFAPEYLNLKRRGIYQKMRYLVGAYLSKRSVLLADKSFCISHTQYHQMREALGTVANRIEVAPLGVDSSTNYASLRKFDLISKLPFNIRHVFENRIHKDSFIICNVSNYYEHKNIYTLLTATKMIAEECNNTTLILTANISNYKGTKNTQIIEEQSLCAELEEKGILFDLGTIDHQSVKALIALSSVFAFPSTVESFGHPLLEAMSVETPVIASDTPIHREICRDAALFHSALNAGELAQMLRQVRDDRTTEKSVISKGQIVVKNYSWAAHVEQICDSLFRLIYSR